MKISKEAKFALAVIFQLVVIFSIILFKLAVISSGIEVLLEIAPVDPRDPLRGDYLTFTYKISSPFQEIGFMSEQINPGDQVYVVLREAGKFWVAKSVTKTMPTGENIVFIKGRCNSAGRIAFGIEQFFIPEGKGSNLSFRGNPYAKVALDKSGNAVLKQVYVDDRPVFGKIGE